MTTIRGAIHEAFAACWAREGGAFGTTELMPDLLGIPVCVSLLLAPGSGFLTAAGCLLFRFGLRRHAFRQLFRAGLTIPLLVRLVGNLALDQELGELPPLGFALERHVFFDRRAFPAIVSLCLERDQRRERGVLLVPAPRRPDGLAEHRELLAESGLGHAEDFYGPGGQILLRERHKFRLAAPHRASERVAEEKTFRRMHPQVHG